MAINATAVWEIRATGAATNGGGYDAAISGAGTDYTMQDAAQLSLADLACAANATTLTSTTGGFTSAMIGNAIYIASGTNFTANFYFITGYTNTNTVTLDRAPCTSNASSGAGKVGGAQTTLSLIFTALGAQAYVGNFWIKAGSYDWSSTGVAFFNTSTDTANYFRVHGYNSTRGDKPQGTSRPLISMGTQVVSGNLYWEIAHLSFTGSGTQVLNIANNQLRLVNCKSVNTGGAGKSALTSSSVNNVFIGCEFSNPGGYAVATGTAEFIGCYFHDSLYGIYALGASARIINCIFDTCSNTGIRFNASSQTIISCTFYNCGVGLDLVANANIKIYNTIITGCTTGISSSAQVPSYMSYNNVWNNTTDCVNYSKGFADITGDPLLNDPANGNFTLQSSSPAIGAGAQNGTATGAVGSYNWAIGAAQAAAGGVASIPAFAF